jgi:hypothetical protein
VQIKEQQHENRRLPIIETTLQDVRYGVARADARARLLAVAVATLALASAPARAVFSVVGAGAAAAAAVREPRRLVRIFETNPLRRWTRTSRRRPTTPTGEAEHELHRHRRLRAVHINGSGASDVFLTGFGEPQG